VVDGFPECITAGQNLVNVCSGRVSNLGQYHGNTEFCRLDLPGGFRR
jgi:hypothetical protein